MEVTTLPIAPNTLEIIVESRAYCRQIMLQGPCASLVKNSSTTSQEKATGVRMTPKRMSYNLPQLSQYSLTDVYALESFNTAVNEERS